MRLKKITLGFIIAAAALPTAAQTTREEMFADICKTAGVYYAYPAPEKLDYTAAPKGYKPFYISHFGRHGSRYLIGENEYTDPIEKLAAAERAALFEQARPRRAVYGPVHAAPAQQRGVGRVGDGVRVRARDVALYDTDAFCHMCSLPDIVMDLFGFICQFIITFVCIEKLVFRFHDLIADLVA